MMMMTMTMTHKHDQFVLDSTNMRLQKVGLRNYLCKIYLTSLILRTSFGYLLDSVLPAILSCVHVHSCVCYFPPLLSSCVSHYFSLCSDQYLSLYLHQDVSQLSLRLPLCSLITTTLLSDHLLRISSSWSEGDVLHVQILDHLTTYSSTYLWLYSLWVML